MTSADADMLPMADRRIRDELIALAMHDLGHQVFHVCHLVQSLSGQLEKLGNSIQISKLLLDDRADLEQAAAGLEDVVNSLRALTRTNASDRRTKFAVADAIAYVKNVLHGTLRRNRIEFMASVPPDLVLIGKQEVLAQALLILALNSIDAIRGATSHQPHRIQVLCEQHGPPDTLRVFWEDNGTGISPVFQDIDEVFEIGKTTHDAKAGAGAGLFVARRMLDAEFGGTISAVNRSPAVFRLELPIKPLENHDEPKNSIDR